MQTKHTEIPLKDTGFFSDLLLSYLQKDKQWNPFLSFQPGASSVLPLIEQKKATYKSRHLLAEKVKSSYAGLACNEKLKANINALSDKNTFTVTAAHQPVIYGGSMYVALKLMHTIKLAAHLNMQFPAYQFVPVYVMGSEDHDFDEIAQTALFGRQVYWEREAEGPVGRLDLNGFEQLGAFLKEFSSGGEWGSEVLENFEQIREQTSTFADFHFRWMHTFFGKKGLIVVQPDDADFKKLMVDEWKKELQEGIVEKCFLKTTEKWPEGFDLQATPRDINLFYTGNGQRERLTREGAKNGIRLAESDTDLPEDEWVRMLEKKPDDFSPNVFLRPLYQCTILPDIAFVGGPSEIAYWMELKAIFDQADVTFPMLLPRASMMWVDAQKSKKMQKLHLTPADLFRSMHEVIKANFLEEAGEKLMLETESNQLGQVFNQVLKKALDVDKTLERAVLGEKKKAENALKNLEQKMIRAVKRMNEDYVRQIENLWEKLFPDGSLQERKEAFLSFYILYGDEFLDVLEEKIEPFENAFKIIEVVG